MFVRIIGLEPTRLYIHFDVFTQSAKTVPKLPITPVNSTLKYVYIILPLRNEKE